MTRESIVHEYLSLMDSQRETLVIELDGTSPEKLWTAPPLDAWSIGEQLYHLSAWLACYRRRLDLFYRTLYPIGWLIRHRPYPTEIEDVYSREKFPNYVGFLCSSRHVPDRSLALGTLVERLQKSHDRVRRFYLDKDESLLGHLWLYDTSIGWVNMIQALRIAVYHDQHHYDLIMELQNTPVEPDPDDDLP
jgi:hypothetical protein